MNSNGSASRFPGLLRLKSPLKNFSMTINANAADEFFNFTSGGKKMTSNQPGTQCPDPRSPKYTLSSLKRFELPEKTSSAQSSLKSLLSSNTDRVKRANRNGKETHNRTDRTNEINTTIFDSSFTNLTSLVSPSNKTVISPSNKIRLKDLCKSASQQTLTHSNTNDSCSKEGDIPSKQGLQTTTGFNRRQLKASTEKLNNDLDVSCQIKPMAKERSSIGYYFGNLQKTAHGHRPARLRLTLTSNKSLSNLSLSRSGMEESMQQEAVKSVPSIKELYHESIMSKFDGFFDKTQTNGNTDRNDMIPSLLKIEEEKRAEPPLIPQEKEQEKEKDVAEKTSVSQAKVLAHSDLINKLIHPRKLQTTRREPYKFGKKGVIDPNLKQAIEKRLNLSMAQENVNRQSLTQFHTVANKSPRKSVKKPLRVISSKKELWIKCFDNEQIEIPEKSLGTKFIPPPQNPLVSSSSFQKLQSKEITIPAKRDFKKVRVAFIEAVRNIKLLKLTPKDLNNKIFSTVPYENQNSREFIHAAKLGDITTLERLLDQNKYLVYDFDNVHQTALHWATKRGQKKTVELLVEYGADLNATDLLGRRPLYFAIHTNNIEIMKFLLKSRCDPWSTSKVNYSEMVENNRLAKYYLSKARQIHILMAMTPVRQRQEIWNKKSTSLIRDPIIAPAPKPKGN